MDCGASTMYEETNFRLYLPTTINKLMEFKFIDAAEFKSKWNRYNTKVIKSSEISIDPNVAKKVPELKNYFSGLIDLKSKKTTKFGGCFELDIPAVDYLIKIVSVNNGNIVIQIAAPQESKDIAAFLLQTLGFLLRA